MAKTTAKPCTINFAQRRIENIYRDQSGDDKLQLLAINCQKGLIKLEQMIDQQTVRFYHSEAQCSNFKPKSDS